MGTCEACLNPDDGDRKFANMDIGGAGKFEAVRSESTGGKSVIGKFDDEDENPSIEWTTVEKEMNGNATSFGRPLQYNKGQFIFLAVNDDDDNKLFYGIYDGSSYKTLEFISKYENYSSDNPINPSSPQCIDSTTNIIYIINNNKDILSINIATKTIKLENNITTTGHNSATICYNPKNNKIYIFGGIAADKEKEKNNENLIFIQYYKKGKKTKTKTDTTVTYFGNLSQTIYEKDRILICGGVTDYDHEDDDSKSYDDDNDKYDISKQFIPTKQIWSCSSLNNADFKWSKLKLHRPLRSFGLINYKNKFIFIFGGTEIREEKSSEETKKFTVEAINVIHILDCTVESKDRHWWLMNDVLKEAGNYHAILSSNNKYVDLINIDNGNHYQINMKLLLDFKKNSVEASKCGDAGKTVLPTKDDSIKIIQPGTITGGKRKKVRKVKKTT